MTITSPTERATRWTVDVENTSAGFAVKTFWGLATVRGHFDRFSGFYEFRPDGPRIELAIDADSIDTGNSTRDKHLRSADFFGVAEHPALRFTSTRVRHVGDGLHVEGRLEVAGRSVPLEFDASVRAVDHRLEIEAVTAVDHRLFGMSSGPLGMIRPPVRLNVRARLNDPADAESDEL